MCVPFSTAAHRHRAAASDTSVGLCVIAARDAPGSLDPFTFVARVPVNTKPDDMSGESISLCVQRLQQWPLGVPIVPRERR